MMTVFYLQEDVEHLGMRLFYLVEEDDGIGFSAHLFGELPSLVVADVAGGGADEFGDVVLLHILRHIHADEQIFVAEHRLGKRLGKLRLAHARGT